MGYFLYIQTPTGNRRIETEFSSYNDANTYAYQLVQSKMYSIRDYEIVHNPDSRPTPKFKLQLNPYKTTRKWNLWRGCWED